MGLTGNSSARGSHEPTGRDEFTKGRSMGPREHLLSILLITGLLGARVYSTQIPVRHPGVPAGLREKLAG